MKLGLEVSNVYVPGVSYREKLEELLEEVAVARDYGFEGVFVGQHFLSAPQRTLQPIPLLGRLAAVAGEMWLGTGILLLPFYHPVDVAEQIATIDTICNGRFIFGVGLGYEEEEFSAFGIDRRDRAGRFEESLEIIERLWTDDEVTFQGRHFTLSDVVPTARPLQKPNPPIWIAADGDPAVRRAARMGDGWFASPHAVLKTLGSQIEIYREELSNAEKPAPQHIPLMRDAYVAESKEIAFKESRPYLENEFRVYVEQGQDKELPPGDEFDKPFEELSVDRFIIGDPDDCIRELRRYESLGFDYMVLEFQMPSMPRELGMKCLHLLGKEVLPRVR